MKEGISVCTTLWQALQWKNTDPSLNWTPSPIGSKSLCSDSNATQSLCFLHCAAVLTFIQHIADLLFSDLLSFQILELNGFIKTQLMQTQSVFSAAAVSNWKLFTRKPLDGNYRNSCLAEVSDWGLINHGNTWTLVNGKRCFGCVCFSTTVLERQQQSHMQIKPKTIRMASYRWG